MQLLENDIKKLFELQVDFNRQYTSQEKMELKTIIDSSKTVEELLQAVLLYFSFK